MIAGIFAFMPIDKATTVHTTIQSTVQGTQLNNADSTFDTDLATNATAGCGAGAGDFLVYWTFSNDTIAATNTLTKLLIDDLSSNGTDITITLSLSNQTSVSGVLGATSGETITLSGSPTGTDTGEVALTVLCQSGSTPTLIPQTTGE